MTTRSELNPNKVLIEGVQLSKEVGNHELKRKILVDVNVTLHQGCFHLLMGPSGSGKSTLLAAISGLQKPDSGHVYFEGQNIWEGERKSAQRFRNSYCGFIFQNVHLMPFLTAQEQIEFVLNQKGVSPRLSRDLTHESLELVGLGKKKNQLPASLSGGEQQRVAIARAIAHKPPLIFADEPTSALDSKNGQNIIEILSNASKVNGTAVFAVTHDERVKHFADKIFYIEDGKLMDE